MSDMDEHMSQPMPWCIECGTGKEDCLHNKIESLEAENKLLKDRHKVETVNALNHGTSDEIMRLDAKITRYLISSL